jgi:outer membrane protein TolC
VKKLYYGIQQAQSSLSAAGEAVKLYRETESLVARYLAEQVVLKGDHLDAQVRLARAEQSQLTFEDQIASGKEQLNHLMGRDVLTAFEVTGALEAAEFESDVEAARGRALAQRPEVRQARLKLDQAEQDRRLKRSEYIPDISASFNSVEVVGFNTFIPLHFNSVGVNISWEPFDWGRKKHDLVGKDRAIEQARNSAADAEGQVILDVNDSFRKLRESRVQLRVARLQQETAIENLRVVQEKFKQQASLTREVLSSQSSLEQANADYRQALIFFWTTKADFEHAVGDNP